MLEKSIEALKLLTGAAVRNERLSRSVKCTLQSARFLRGFCPTANTSNTKTIPEQMMGLARFAALSVFVFPALVACNEDNTLGLR
jgi:hypothetical protein